MASGKLAPPDCFVSDFIDLDRIEVLRGPQGTTYGRDSVGGAIRMWTRPPGEEFGGQLTVTTGSYDRRDVKASLDLPITDTLRTKWTDRASIARASSRASRRASTTACSTQDTLRGDVVWEPTDRLSFRLILNSEDLVMNEPRIQDGIYDTAYIPGGPFNGYQVVQNWGSFRRSSMGWGHKGAEARRRSRYRPFHTRELPGRLSGR